MEISRTFKFDAAHFLLNYKGKCSQLHGHTYKLKITLNGEPNSETNMIIDFGMLKSFFKQNIEPIFDHKTIVAIDSPNILTVETKHYYRFTVTQGINTKIYVLPKEDVTKLPLPNTTVEVLASYIKSLTTIYFKLPCTIEMWEGGAGSVKI